MVLSRWLILSDGSKFKGHALGSKNFKTAELVFHTGMTGYIETITDPSFKGQILCFTYPSIGNYGVDLIGDNIQSNMATIASLIVADCSDFYDDTTGGITLDQYLNDEDIAGISGVDTRELITLVRDSPPLLATLSDIEDGTINEVDSIELLNSGIKKFYCKERSKDLSLVLVIDCGCKQGIIDLLLNNNVDVVSIDYRIDYHLQKDELGSYDAIIISNGPGNPKDYELLIGRLTISMNHMIPMFGICLGHQVLAIAAGATTFLLDHSHRSHNQPIINLKTSRCYNSAQNHSYAVSKDGLPNDWVIWFENLNDGSIEGLYHKNGLFRTVQFHPEGCSGPQDLSGLLLDFLNEIIAL